METYKLRSLKDFVKECGANLSNTIGMGNVSFPTDTTVGSGDIFQFKKVKRNKKLKLDKNSKKINEKLTLNKQTKATKSITKKQISEFVKNYLANASSGLIRLLQKEMDQWYLPSEIDKKIYELDSNKSPIKDLMEYTAKKLNITFDELWSICNNSSFLFRSIIQKQNPYK